MMQDVICTSPGCMKPIEDPLEQQEKTFLVVKTGQVVTLRRHDACAAKYETDGFKRISGVELSRALSPASTRKRGLDKRRASHKRMDDYRYSAFRRTS